MLTHDDHLLSYDLELVFLWNDGQAAHVVPVHQYGTDIIHAVHRSSPSGRRLAYPPGGYKNLTIVLYMLKLYVTASKDMQF